MSRWKCAILCVIFALFATQLHAGNNPLLVEVPYRFAFDERNLISAATFKQGLLFLFKDPLAQGQRTVLMHFERNWYVMFIPNFNGHTRNLKIPPTLRRISADLESIEGTFIKIDSLRENTVTLDLRHKLYAHVNLSSHVNRPHDDTFEISLFKDIKVHPFADIKTYHGMSEFERSLTVSRNAFELEFLGAGLIVGASRRQPENIDNSTQTIRLIISDILRYLSSENPMGESYLTEIKYFGEAQTLKEWLRGFLARNPNPAMRERLIHLYALNPSPVINVPLLYRDVGGGIDDTNYHLEIRFAERKWPILNADTGALHRVLDLDNLHLYALPDQTALKASALRGAKASRLLETLWPGRWPKFISQESRSHLPNIRLMGFKQLGISEHPEVRHLIFEFKGIRYLLRLAPDRPPDHLYMALIPSEIDHMNYEGMSNRIMFVALPVRSRLVSLPQGDGRKLDLRVNLFGVDIDISTQFTHRPNLTALITDTTRISIPVLNQTFDVFHSMFTSDSAKPMLDALTWSYANKTNTLSADLQTRNAALSTSGLSEMLTLIHDIARLRRSHQVDIGARLSQRLYYIYEKRGADIFYTLFPGLTGTPYEQLPRAIQEAPEDVLKPFFWMRPLIHPSLNRVVLSVFKFMDIPPTPESKRLFDIFSVLRMPGTVSLSDLPLPDCN